MIRKLLLFAIFLPAWGLLAEQPGHIQVSGRVGLSILLDEQPAGTTGSDTAEPLVIPSVSPGEHRLAAIRDGQRVVDQTVAVAAGRVLQFVVAEPPAIVVEEEGEPTVVPERTGVLQIQSLPVDCQIEIPDLGLGPVHKSRDVWRASRVPPGRYVVIGRRGDTTLTAEVLVRPGERSAWLFDFPHEEAREQRLFRNPFEMDFVHLPAATVQLGDRAGRSFEQPREARLTVPFWISTREVTVGQWRAVMGTEGAIGGPVRDSRSTDPVLVSWDAAVAFTQRLNALAEWPAGTYRLPTDAEWEYACRAGSTGDYAGNLDEIGWYDANSLFGYKPTYLEHARIYELHPVGAKQPNAFGLFDMHGSRWEWCADRCRKIGSRIYDIQLDTDGDGVTNPLGRKGDCRIIRGGNYRSPAEQCTSWYRNAYPPYWTAGFRVVSTEAPRGDGERTVNND